MFTDTLWPDFDRTTLTACVVDYQARDRRYGRAVDRVTPGEG